MLVRQNMFLGYKPILSFICTCWLRKYNDDLFIGMHKIVSYNMYICICIA